MVYDGFQNDAKNRWQPGETNPVKVKYMERLWNKKIILLNMAISMDKCPSKGLPYYLVLFVFIIITF